MLTPAEQIRQALRDKGYRPTHTVDVPGHRPGAVKQYEYYFGHGRAFVLEVQVPDNHGFQGCELYQTVHSGLSITDTIARIPQESDDAQA
jgi:hypothetical protein